MNMVKSSAKKLDENADKAGEQLQSSARFWRFERLPKYASTGVTRAIHPRKTVRRALAVASKAGISKVADVSGLDRLGIPNFMSVRPRDLGPGISYYNGKGTTRADAYAGALMEAIERQGGESCGYRVYLGSRNAMQATFSCIDPAEINVPRCRDYNDNLSLEWALGYDLLQQRASLVPLNLIVCPYAASAGATVFYASTNGLASGNSRTEAVCHALCEVIERDALAIAMARYQLKPAVMALTGRPMAKAQSARWRQINCDRLPLRAARLVAKMRYAGLQVFLRDLTCTAGVATIDCTLVELAPDGIPNAHGGCGTHPDARVALLRALTEAAQSRIACIQGGREDLPEIIRPASAYDVEDFYGGGEAISFEELPSVENKYINEDIELLLARLPASGIHQLVAFDLTRPDVGVPVVRLIAPRAEAWTVYHLHTGRGTFGQRVAKEL